MAQYWYKKDKRVKRIPEQDDSKAVIQQVKDLKANGFTRTKPTNKNWQKNYDRIFGNKND